jgi:hypothetical protein
MNVLEKLTMAKLLILTFSKRNGGRFVAGVLARAGKQTKNGGSLTSDYRLSDLGTTGPFLKSA